MVDLSHKRLIPYFIISKTDMMHSYSTNDGPYESSRQLDQHSTQAQNTTLPLSYNGVIVRCAVEVVTPVEHIWDILIDKIKNPARYDPQITAFQIVKEVGTDQVERVIAIGGGRKVLRERVAIDPVTKTVLYKMSGDEHFRGYVTNSLYEDEETGIVTMEFLMNWTSKCVSAPYMTEHQAKQVLRDVVNHTKDIAENEFLQGKGRLSFPEPVSIP